MTMYTEYTYNDSLAHHGILGQKWGVLNGPPYPLSYQSHSRTEQKRNSTSRIDGISKHNKPKSSDNRLIKENKKNSKNNIQTIKSKSSTKTTSKSTSKPKASTNPSNKTETKGKKQLTEKQKKVLKGVAIGAGVAAVAGLSAYAYHKNPAVKKAVDDFVRGFKSKTANQLSKTSPKIKPEESFIIGDNGRKIYDTYADGTKNPLAHLGISLQTKIGGVTQNADGTFTKTIKVASDSSGLNRSMADYEHDLFVCNKNARGYIVGRNHNCISNAINMFFRDKGIDSVAKEQIGSYGTNEGLYIAQLFNFSKEDKAKLISDMTREISTDDLFKEFAAQPNGSCGILGVDMLRDEGKHFMYWKKVGNEFHILDGQLEIAYEPSQLKSLFSNTLEKGNKDASFMANGSLLLRLDNRDIKYDLATRYIEPNLGGYYNITDDLASKWDKYGIPESKTVLETMKNGKIKRSVAKSYRYMKGALE